MKFHLILIVSEVYRFFVVELFENSLYGVKYVVILVKILHFLQENDKKKINVRRDQDTQESKTCHSFIPLIG